MEVTTISPDTARPCCGDLVVPEHTEQRVGPAPAFDKVVAGIALEIVGTAVVLEHIAEARADGVLNSEQQIVAAADLGVAAGQVEVNPVRGVVKRGDVATVTTVERVVALPACSTSLPSPP